MDGIQITDKKTLEAITKKELFDSVDSAKIKLTKTLLIREDFNTLKGDARAVYPVIPGRIGVGKVVETCGDEIFGIERGVRVFPHPEVACGKCYECINGNFASCSAFNVAGKNVDGFLRDFAIFPDDAISILPPTVSDYDALFIDHVALCDNIIDAIGLKKGEHVVIVGGDALGIILAQLVIYYQGVPILVDNNDNNIITAKNAGVYYTLFADNKIEKNVTELTGARMAKKVVYMTGSNLNTDIALRLSGHNATVCFAGFGSPSIKVNFNVALLKQLEFKCVTTGYGNIESAINILANKAVDTGVFSIQQVKKGAAMEKIKEMSESLDYSACSGMLIIDVD